MLDRLISGAGAVTDGADRSVRLLTSGSTGSPAATRPGSVAIAALLLVLAGLLLLAGVEASDPATPVTLAPAMVADASAHMLGDRTYATLTGALATDWVETYEDANDNGTEDADEHGTSWFYWLIDPTRRRGVTVRSARPPTSIFRYHGSGIVKPEPFDLVDPDPSYDAEVTSAGLHVDPTTIIDATAAGATAQGTIRFDLAGPLPSAGTAVDVSGSRTGGYRLLCSHDLDRDGTCDQDEIDRVEIAVFDPATKRGVRVLLDEPPAFSEASLTGELRRDERAVDDARSTKGFHFEALRIGVSDRYVLDDAVPPATAPLAFVLAFVLAVVAGTILAGLAGGYLIYRRAYEPLPSAATSLGPGDRIGLRLTGVVRTPTGLVHLREAPGELIRFVLGRPAVTPELPAAPEPADPSTADDDASIATTLIVERTGLAQGVALGRGELRRVSAGRVMTFRAPRPALRVVAGTGPLFLSFDSEAERDRAAAELLDEAGLAPDGGPTRSV